MVADQSTVLQHCLDRLRAGDTAARDELLQCAQRRLLQLTRKMFKDFPRLRGWEESQDVLHSSLVRLYRAWPRSSWAGLEFVPGEASRSRRFGQGIHP